MLPWDYTINLQQNALSPYAHIYIGKADFPVIAKLNAPPQFPLGKRGLRITQQDFINLAFVLYEQDAFTAIKNYFVAGAFDEKVLLFGNYYCSFFKSEIAGKEPMIDIREFYVGSDGTLHPSRNGVCLPYCVFDGKLEEAVMTMLRKLYPKQTMRPCWDEHDNDSDCLYCSLRHFGI